MVAEAAEKATTKLCYMCARAPFFPLLLLVRAFILVVQGRMKIFFSAGWGI